MSADTVGKTLGVSIALCIACSVLVSSAAILLKDKQNENKVLDVKKNLLLSAGLIKNTNATSEEINNAFTNVETLVINLDSGIVDKNLDHTTYDQKKAAKDPSLNKRISSKMDLGKIKRRAKLGKAYLVKNNGILESVVIPVHGKGLWSTLYGFLSLSADTTTVKGFGFYQHGETPGLGGEVDNPNWKALWVGKKVFDDTFSPIIEVVKGQVNPNSSKVDSQIDGLSGATITSNGVSNLVKYWLGEDGYGPFLANLRNSGGTL